MLDTPLNASANSAGAVFSNNMFEVPRYQREYSWGRDERTEFWNDLRGSIDADSYFLGLLILTKAKQDDADKRKQVVDGQQRIITLSLLANALYHEAIARDRKALADRLQASFLRSIDFDSDEQVPRVKLSDAVDNATFQTILSTGKVPSTNDPDSVSARIIATHEFLVLKLREDLKADPFKRLGRWTEFLTNRLYFAVFVHPDPGSAYQVFEVINTRGKDLTTADLLKNYVLSQEAPERQLERYAEWQSISRSFPTDGANNFVQYIRHVVTAKSGYVLPKDLFEFLASRNSSSERQPPRSNELMARLSENLPLYLQMIDQTAAGPADAAALGVFSALNSLNVITVRPILLACYDVPDAIDGMHYILRLVVRRIIVGNLGTGNVERRFGEAARAVSENRNWQAMIEHVGSLNPGIDEFTAQIQRRSLNRTVLDFMRRSLIQQRITPSRDGYLHHVWTKQAPFPDMTEDQGSFWASTLANTYLSELDKRPKDLQSWRDFKEVVLPTGVRGEWRQTLEQLEVWNVPAIENLSIALAEEAGRIWYDA